MMFGQAVKYHRERLGMTWDQMAVVMGKRSTWVAEMERGIHPPPGDGTISMIAGVLGVPSIYLKLLAGRMPSVPVFGRLTAHHDPERWEAAWHTFCLSLSAPDKYADESTESAQDLRAVLRMRRLRIDLIGNAGYLKGSVRCLKATGRNAEALETEIALDRVIACARGLNHDIVRIMRMREYRLRMQEAAQAQEGQ